MKMKHMRTVLAATTAVGLTMNFAFADQVILDDLIVDGSQCVGLDCVNGENFGFDTIRLKENNLRIHFDDTSTTASFPRNDWRIRINDSNNGGDSYFAVEDVTGGRTPFQVEAGAGNNSLFVESSGDVGFGTNNPVVRMHGADGDTPTVRLEQNGTSGWTPQTWDVAGNETNFFIRDASNGSTLPFRIRPGAPTDTLRLNETGDIGMGTSSPDAKLQVAGGDGTILVSDTDSDGVNKLAHFGAPSFDNSNPPAIGMVMDNRVDGSILSFGGGNSAFSSATVTRFFTAPNVTAGALERMRIQFDGTVMIARTANDPGNIFQVGTDATNGNGAALTNAGVWTNGSSRLNKIDIKKLDSKAARDAVLNMETVTYKGKQNSDETYVGFIAEDIPELIAMNNRKGIAAIEVAAVLAKVVKDHQHTIDTQEKAIETLSQRLADLEAKLVQIQDQ